MSLLDRIITWLNGKQSVTEKQPVKQVPETELTKNLFEQPSINTSTMVNTITLSSDMETLYLIDDGRAIEFKITEAKGILVGTLNGQVTVVTSLHPPKEEVEAPIGTDTGDAALPTSLAKPGMPQEKKVSVSTKGDQWTIFFNRGNEVMALIGIGEIDTSIENPEKLEAEFYTFPLKTNVVQIRKKDGKIEFQLVKKF